ncbi:MAG TPA: hypothetical protein VFR93_08855, partial [Candidatus Limnocylindrales bacterium]|nr:hypothetical protein [Candidatus Limnocylindrales bacterium]
MGALVAAVLVGWLGATPTAIAAPPRFLTLPFASTAGMQVQLVWRAGRIAHHAIDYVRGTRDVASTWRTFPVLAAADGEACAQLAGHHGCVDIPNEKVTNRVAIRHDVGGTTYTTVYEDLASISPSIPIGGRRVHVTRGQPLGMTGNGEGNPADLIHLHFVVLDA